MRIDKYDASLHALARKEKEDNAEYAYDEEVERRSNIIIAEGFTEDDIYSALEQVDCKAITAAMNATAKRWGDCAPMNNDIGQLVIDKAESIRESRARQKAEDDIFEEGRR